MAFIRDPIYTNIFQRVLGANPGEDTVSHLKDGICLAGEVYCQCEPQQDLAAGP